MRGLRVSVLLPSVLGALSLCGAISCTDDGAGVFDGGPGESPDGSTLTTDAAASDGAVDGSDSAPVDPGAGWSFETIQEQTVDVSGNKMRVELIRAKRPDGGRSYVLYTHAPKLTSGAPLLIMNEPYGAIDWTGEPSEARWAALGKGVHPDIDAPAYNDRDKVEYAPSSIQSTVEGQTLWIINGAAVMRAYGRFYAGGVLADDVLDAAAPYFLARTRAAELDLGHIGSYGGSWGGMMTLFGARAAPPDARPLVSVAISPVSDFIDLWKWSKTDLPAAQPTLPAEPFFSPYWRRSTPSVGSPPVVGEMSKPFTHAGLCPGLPGRVLVPHDAWDTIIPLRESEQLAAACPNVEPLFWRRQTGPIGAPKIDHGPMAEEATLPSVFSFAYSFVALGIFPAPAPVTSVADEAALEVFLRLVLAEQRAKGDASVAYVVPQLRMLADPRLSLLDSTSFAPHPGAEVVANAINGVWKTSFDAAGVRAQLATGLPTPPIP